MDSHLHETGPTVIDKSQLVESIGSRLRDRTRTFNSGVCAQTTFSYCVKGYINRIGYLSWPTTSQKLWINAVPAYSNLPVYAKIPASTIVRDMENGYGDRGAATSFSYFYLFRQLQPICEHYFNIRQVQVRLQFEYCGQ
jgi:hypothetical protein